MIHPNEVNRIRRMSFNQLRNELAYCDDNPTKEMLIRNIMKEKYIRYKKRKRELEERKKKKPIRYFSQDTTIDNDIPIKSILDDVEEPVSIIDDIDIFPKHGSLDELDDSRTNKFKNGVDKDFMNNNLMDRLNSDIDIRKTKIENKRNFVPPFSNDVGGNYAPFRHNKDIPQNDFSNRKKII